MLETDRGFTLVTLRVGEVARREERSVQLRLPARMKLSLVKSRGSSFELRVDIAVRA